MEIEPIELKIDYKELDKQLTLVCELVSYAEDFNLNKKEQKLLAGLEELLSAMHTHQPNKLVSKI